MPSVTSYRPARAQSWDWRHKLGSAVSGQSSWRNAVASKSQTTRPSSAVIFAFAGAATRPRSASSKSVRSAKSGAVSPVTGGTSRSGLACRGPVRARSRHPQPPRGRPPREWAERVAAVRHGGGQRRPLGNGLKLLDRYAQRLADRGSHLILCGVQPPLLRLLKRPGSPTAPRTAPAPGYGLPRPTRSPGRPLRPTRRRRHLSTPPRSDAGPFTPTPVRVAGRKRPGQGRRLERCHGARGRHPGPGLDRPKKIRPRLEALYKDLHAHPELSFAEIRTGSADRGAEVTVGHGGHEGNVAYSAASSMTAASSAIRSASRIPGRA